MQRLATRPWVAAGVAGVVVALLGAPVPTSTAPLPGDYSPSFLLTAEDITLDLVRHGQSTDNAEGILGTVPPGAELTDAGQQQAADVAPAIAGEYPNGIDGIFASELVRAQETAQPLADLLGMNTQILAGLNELNAGWLEGQPLNAFTELGYVFAPVMWIMGQYWVPQLGSDVDPNGVAFDDRVTDAIQTIYNGSVSDPHATDTDVVFSHAGTIAVWALMNVKNPDFSVVLDDLFATGQPLDNTGQVVLQGNPIDGWTLVSWDGQDVAATPDLLTGLFVDWRDLITAPQTAGYHILEALQGGDSADIANALQVGFEQVIAAINAFPQAVVDTITGALSG